MPVDTSAEREKKRLAHAWRREVKRRKNQFHFELDRAVWRQRSEEGARRRAMTQTQRDAEDRELEDARLLEERLMEMVP